MDFLPQKIISGGQTGVDQGALDFALSRGIECGGWCPKGRQSETGRIPEKYPVREVENEDYNERTRRNIQDSDATLLITVGNRMEAGTRLTLEWAQGVGKPIFHIDLAVQEESLENRIREVISWYESHSINILNVAGNRESTAAGIQQNTFDILGRIFSPLVAGFR
jgi:hypothetical protein